MNLNYDFATDGERLASLVGSLLIPNEVWPMLCRKLISTGRAEFLSEFYLEIAVITVTCRIVKAGVSMMHGKAGFESLDPDNPTFVKEFGYYLTDRFILGYSQRDRLLRSAISAVKATREQVTAKEHRRYRTEAQRANAVCYMCGKKLDYTGVNPHDKFDVEHVWPRLYGGNSIEDNLLPACGACNNQRKTHFATWAMPSIQSLILEMDKSEDNREKIEGPLKFALHYYAARKLLQRRPEMTLKQAFLRLRPWTTPRYNDNFEVGDFVNLVNHQYYSDL